MLHVETLYTVKPLDTVEELIAELYRRESHELDQGFLFDGVLYLNDSLSTDPARYWEYAAMKPIDGCIPSYGTVVCIQKDSLTVNAGTHSLGLRSFLLGMTDEPPMYTETFNVLVRMRDKEGVVIRETPNYIVYDNEKNSIVIIAKAKSASKPRMSFYLGRTWDAATWKQLQRMNDASFDGSCALELGIGTFSA